MLRTRSECTGPFWEPGIRGRKWRVEEAEEGRAQELGSPRKWEGATRPGKAMAAVGARPRVRTWLERAGEEGGLAGRGLTSTRTPARPAPTPALRSTQGVFPVHCGRACHAALWAARARAAGPPGSRPQLGTHERLPAWTAVTEEDRRWRAGAVLPVGLRRHSKTPSRPQEGLSSLCQGERCSERQCSPHTRTVGLEPGLQGSR